MLRTPPNRYEPEANEERVARHVAIIMDGNHRWARQRRLPSAMGHRTGAKNVRPIVEACADEGVRYVSLFAFSTENWARPPKEIELLFSLIRETLNRDLDALDERDAKLMFIGDISRFPRDLQRLLRHSERRTQDNKTLTLIIALSYGGRWDVVEAAKRIAVQAAQGELDPHSLDETEFERHLSMSDVPNPDLCIRTGGDQRLSNFMLWDLAYTELFFTDTYWPDFTQEELVEVLDDFSRRRRRFGARNAGAIQTYRATH